VGDGVFNRCIECEDIITNPICPDCLVQQMRVMVAEKNPSLAKDIDGIYIEGGTNCFQCGKSTGLCAHCFSKDIYFQIKEKDLLLAQEFAQRFDYDLRAALL